MRVLIRNIGRLHLLPFGGGFTIRIRHDGLQIAQNVGQSLHQRLVDKVFGVLAWHGLEVGVIWTQQSELSVPGDLL